MKECCHSVMTLRTLERVILPPRQPPGTAYPELSYSSQVPRTLALGKARRPNGLGSAMVAVSQEALCHLPAEENCASHLTNGTECLLMTSFIPPRTQLVFTEHCGDKMVNKKAPSCTHVS